MTSQFDVEGFFGAILISSFRTADPANMKQFLAAYLVTSEPKHHLVPEWFAVAWKAQERTITGAISADPSGSKGLAPGEKIGYKQATLWP